MPDPIFDRFSSDVTEEVSRMQPLPAEVRRRGDRLRRRNHALATVAAVAAVGVIAAPFTFLGDGPGSEGVDPADQAWVTTIPPGFDLTTGLPETGSQQEDLTPEQIHDPAYRHNADAALELHPCPTAADAPAWTVDAGTDASWASWSDGIEGGTFRTLVTYADDEAASAALASVRDAVTGCASPAAGERGIFPFPLTADVGEEGIAYLEQYRDRQGPNGEGTLTLLTRVGNAVLVDRGYTGGAGDLARMQQSVDATGSLLSGVVTAMERTFGDSAAAPETVSADEPAATSAPASPLAVPAGFPLDLDAPDPTGDGGTIAGPGPDAEGVRLSPGPCNAAGLDLVPHVDRLGFSAAGPEAYDGRDLRVYASVGHAEEVLRELRVAASECVSEQVDGGSTIRWRLFASETSSAGDESLTFGYTDDQPGGALFHLVRVGQAVLALERDGEWAPESMAAAVPALEELGREIAGELCVFAQEGCTER